MNCFSEKECLRKSKIVDPCSEIRNYDKIDFGTRINDLRIWKRKTLYAAVNIILIIMMIFISHHVITYAAGAGAGSILKEGDSSMAKRSLDGCEKALIKYRDALKMEPENMDIKIKIADALNLIMRIKTNGNALRIDGSTQDTEKNKAVWKEYGVEAVKLAEQAAKERPSDCRALLAYAESYMYYSASFGIIKAILQGAAGQYKENANALIKYCPRAEDAVGHIYLGGFYVAAPWPMSDLDEAEKQYQKVRELAPVSVRAYYYPAVVALKKGKYAEARTDLEYVINNPCSDGPEHDYCGFLKEQAKKGIAIIEEKTKK